MTSEAEVRPTNFIRQIIDEGLATGKYTTVHTRSLPESNGYLHTGHAKLVCLSFGIAQDYRGQCNLRFDDTNPVEENIGCVESTKSDVQWLGFRWSGDVCYSSDYFDQLHQYAIGLINKGLAYVDKLPPNEIREYRGTLKTSGKSSPYCNHSVEENPALSEKMRSGGFEEGKACLCAKINMASSFIVMRDLVSYRTKFAEHHQTGNKWYIYPVYDLTHRISDVLEGITHSLCTLKFQGNRRLYDWVFDSISIPVHPCQYEFSCLNLEYTVVSERKLNQLVTEKHVEGWDGPCIPTIFGLRRHGYTAESIRKFCKRTGVTEQDNTTGMASLKSYVYEDLNENALCAMAVIDPVKLVVESYPRDESEMMAAPSHPNKSETGSREVPFNAEIRVDRADLRGEANKQYKRLVLGKEVRLRNAHVIKTECVEKDAKGNITTIFCAYDADTLSKDSADGRKVEGIIHWVSVAHVLPVEVRLCDYLFSVPNPGVGEDFLVVINPSSLVIKQDYAELSLAQAKTGKTYQSEYGGYLCLDSRYANAFGLVLNHTVRLRNTWAKVGK